MAHPPYRRPWNLFDLSVSAAPKCGDDADAVAVDVDEVCLLSKSLVGNHFLFVFGLCSVLPPKDSLVQVQAGIYIMKCTTKNCVCFVFINETRLSCHLLLSL